MGNVFLLVLNLPLVGLWAQLLRVPYRVLFPVVLLLCVIGAYSAKTAAPSRNDEKHTRPSENRAPAAKMFDQGPTPVHPDQGPTP